MKIIIVVVKNIYFTTIIIIGLAVIAECGERFCSNSISCCGINVECW